MNQALSIELSFFLISVLCGAILLLVYDIFRILRRIIKHNGGFVALEDLLFWVGASLFIFVMLFKENDGIIRGFAIIGMTAGMLLYHYILSDIIVNLVTKLIQTLFRPFAIVLRKIKSFLAFIWKWAKRAINFVTRRLKKWTKSVRISVNKKKQASTDKRLKRINEKRQRKQIRDSLKKPRKKSGSESNRKTNRKRGSNTVGKKDGKSGSNTDNRTDSKTATDNRTDSKPSNNTVKEEPQAIRVMKQQQKKH